MKTFVHLWQYISEFFSEWEMFQTKLYWISKHTFCVQFFLRKSCRRWDNVEKYGKAGEAADNNKTRSMRFACWITKATAVSWWNIFRSDATSSRPTNLTGNFIADVVNECRLFTYWHIVFGVSYLLSVYRVLLIHIFIPNYFGSS
jgi:hypothetical protein